MVCLFVSLVLRNASALREMAHSSHRLIRSCIYTAEEEKVFVRDHLGSQSNGWDLGTNIIKEFILDSELYD